MDDPHAVRWYNRKDRFGNPKWTKWHYTEDSNQTVCGVYIGMAISGGSFLPDTDEIIEKVDCQNCLNKMKE